MRFRTFLSLAIFFLTCLTIAVFAQPLPAGAAEHGGNRAVENQSVSGEIASVGDAALAISIAKDNRGQHTVECLVDDKTKVQGQLTVGAQAMVEYRSVSGKNIAVHVVVTPASGVNPS